MKNQCPFCRNDGVSAGDTCESCGTSVPFDFKRRSSRYETPRKSTMHHDEEDVDAYRKSWVGDGEVQE
jgi:tRNA(Ile2) C34 agmatinyltransferase TiaS